MSFVYQFSTRPNKLAIIYSAHGIFDNLKKHDELIELIQSLKLQSVNDTDVLLKWANLKPLQCNSLLEIWQGKIVKFRAILKYKPNELDILKQYLTLLLSTEAFEKADTLLINLLNKYPNNLEFNKQYIILAHHQKKWEVTEKRFDEFYQLFPHIKSDMFFIFANALYQLGSFEKLQLEYSNFNLKRFNDITPSPDLDTLQINLLLRNYDDIPIKVNTSSCSNRFEHLNDDKYITIKKVIHNEKNETLVLCFSGLQPQANKQYNHNQFATTNIFDNLVEVRGNGHSYDGFANKTTQFNFLLINDFSSSYFALNPSDFLTKIKKSIQSIPHKYLVCTGTSAGGFASILMGQLLQADSIFAFMPRTQAFFYDDAIKFNRALQINSNLIQAENIDIGYLQYQQGGFSTKTYVTLCENNPCDIMSTYSLDKNDPNLHITYCHGDNHFVTIYLGAKNIFIEMTNTIEEEEKNDFRLPIKKGIFSHLDGYKYSS